VPQNVLSVLEGCHVACRKRWRTFNSRHTGQQTAAFQAENAAALSQETAEANFAAALHGRLHFENKSKKEKKNSNLILVENTKWLQDAISDKYVVKKDKTYALLGLTLGVKMENLKRKDGTTEAVEKFSVTCKLCKKSFELTKPLASEALVPDLSNFVNSHVVGKLAGSAHSVKPPKCQELWKAIKAEHAEEWAQLDKAFTESVFKKE